MNKKGIEPTVYDVAKHAGVSPSTVSRVFNSNYPVSNDTRMCVMEAAKSLHYSPKTPETSQKLNTAAVIIPNLQNPFYSSLVTGIEQALYALNTQMLLVNTNGDEKREREILEKLAENPNISGIIISSVCTSNDHIALVIEQGKETVILEQPTNLSCSSVGFNDEKCAQLAVQYLIDRGCKTIGYISSPLTRNNRRDRYRGFLATLRANNMVVNQNWIKIADREERTLDIVYEYKNGEEQIHRIIESGSLPEGIFCGNDITAIGVIATLQRHAIRVPQDISVIGLDNIAYSEMSFPRLTTIDQCIYEIGGVAVQLLRGNVLDPKRKRISLKMEPKLIVRESVK